MDTKFKCLGNRTVVSVDTTSDTIVLGLDNGTRVCIGLFGHCCSSSYFTDESLEEAQQLLEARIQDVEDVEGEGGYEGGTRILWSFLKFTTDKGHVTLDWRNDSNGYYSGYIVLSVDFGLKYPNDKNIGWLTLNGDGGISQHDRDIVEHWGIKIPDLTS